MADAGGLTELEDLRIFLQERIQEADATIDTSLGSSFDNTVLQPLLARLGPDPYNTPIREFILGRLRVEYPDLSLADGEPIDDLVIKIMQILIEPFRRQIQQISNNQSLQDPTTLTDEEADNLGANFFATRREGGFSVGVARLYYSAPQFAVVTPSNPVATGGGLRFFPVENQAITADNMVFNVEDNLYYFDIVVRAEAQGESYNIEPNNLVSVDGASQVVRVSNKRKFEEGGDRESTEEFIDRVGQSLTEKSLVTGRGIQARLTDVFDSVRLIQVIGFGDPEMERDIIEGESQASTYATFQGTTSGDFVDLDSDFTDGVAGHSDFTDGGVLIGDAMTIVDPGTASMTTVTVVEVVNSTRVRVDPTPPAHGSPVLVLIRRASGKIELSGIPGGILQPTTLSGTIEIDPNEIHIGGALDVFVRAGDPQTRDTTIEGVLDGSPLHFGVDLESFGADDEQLIHVTDLMTGWASITGKDRFGADLDPDVYHVLVLQEGPAVEWVPSDVDVNRYVQFAGGSHANFGSFLITEVLGPEYFEDTLGERRYAVRVAIDTSLDAESGAPVTPTLSADFGDDIRVLEKITVADRVRDRDGSRVALVGPPDILSGVDFDALGARVGDSIVIETGDDAGIYSIRRLLSSLDSNDTAILDRDLTQTLTPGGSGDGTGLRYRVADELNIDLVAPKVTKIPLGEVFAGDDLSTVAGSEVVNVGGSTNFLLAGVTAGDTLEIFSGENQGTYGILEVSGTSATLDAPLASTSFSISFSVYRAFSGVDLPLVRVKEVELLDSNSQPTGIKIPYGDVIDARTLGVLGNRAEGVVMEGFNGQTAVSPTNRFTDNTVDFTAEGIRPGQRLNVQTGKSTGAYTIVDVQTTWVDVIPLADGGPQLAGIVETSLRWSIGTASAGFARVYFLEPTTVEIDTGIAGGRLFEDSKEFRFSEVDGYNILPAPGSADDFPRDMRVVRATGGGPPYNTIVELTDDTRPDVYGLEILDGDQVEVNEFVEFRNENGLTFTELGVFGEPAGLQTIGGSNQVEVPSNSLIDFQAMDAAVPLAGQIIFIESGPDAGEYLIEEVLTAKKLRLSRVMTSTTSSIKGQDHLRKRTLSGATNNGVSGGNTLVSAGASFVGDGVQIGDILIISTEGSPDKGAYSISGVAAGSVDVYGPAFVGDTGLDYEIHRIRDAYFEEGSDFKIWDSTDSGELGTLTSEYITIFESTRGDDVDGSYQITDAPVGPWVELSGTIPDVVDKRTLTSTGDDGDSSVGANLFESLSATFQADGVKQGDHLVITSGAGAGRYRIVSATTEQRLSLEVDAPDDTGMDFYIEATSSTDPKGIGLFSWIRTVDDANVLQPFRIYKSVPKKFEVLEVTVKRPDVTGLRRGSIVSPTQLSDDLGTLPAVAAGDTLEVLTGPSAGTYFITSGTASTIDIQAVKPFPVQLSDLPFRVWSGVHGSRRMLKLGALSGSGGSTAGLVTPGEGMPYRVLRPGVFRLSSTEMESNFDGSLYYADIQIESEGSGDELNLERGVRMVATSGVRADGYTYSVENNRLTFSTFEEVSLNFDRRFLPVGNSDSPENRTEVSGRNLKIVYESSTIVRLVNDLLRSEADRPINANPIARHFLPSYVLTELLYQGGVGEVEAGEAIESFINTLGALSELEVSDLEAFLTRRGATSVQHPLSVATVTHDLDRSLVVNRSENSLGGTNAVPYNGTGRISSFFATLGEGLLVTRES